MLNPCLVARARKSARGCAAGGRGALLAALRVGGPTAYRRIDGIQTSASYLLHCTGGYWYCALSPRSVARGWQV